jgi:hypothetical protein
VIGDFINHDASRRAATEELRPDRFEAQPGNYEGKYPWRNAGDAAGVCHRLIGRELRPELCLKNDLCDPIGVSADNVGNLSLLAATVVKRRRIASLATSDSRR